jgi:hypothetical protein
MLRKATVEAYDFLCLMLYRGLYNTIVLYQGSVP